MTDKVDTTAPLLPRVDAEPDTTQPTLQPVKVKETIAALEPVVDAPASTLDLDDDVQEDIVTGPRRVYVPPPPAAPAPPTRSTTHQVKLLDAVGEGTPVAKRRALIRPRGADGFEGGLSADSLPGAEPVKGAAAQKGFLVLVGLAALGLVLAAIFIWFLFFF